LGHPIHIMLIHFPMALFPVGFLFDLLSWLKDEKIFALMGFYCMGTGLVASILAALFGVADFLKLPDDQTIRTKAVIHAGINILVVFVYLGLFIFRLAEFHDQKIVSLMLNIVNGVLVLGLIISAHFGGELILKHKIGMIADEKK
ncbi:MAG TPA: DUF2231 domain-containing protein, partial [Cytophagaceae bacterium]|nr:DUF2231 domain-containing protein [Cytophagaceae bacterium]